jgi:transposase-like protein
VEEGSTENATLVTDLITGLRDRGLDVTKPVLAVLDGAKALSSAVKKVFDKPVIQRCQQHKIANVRDKLPDKLRGHREADAPGLPRRVGPEGRSPSCRRWPASWTRPILAPPRRCARAWPRP